MAATVTTDRDDTIFVVESVIRGHHVYKEVWRLAHELGNCHDRYPLHREMTLTLLSPHGEMTLTSLLPRREITL